jgi:hypothetical protein
VNRGEQTAKFWVAVCSAIESECRALLFPRARDTSQQSLDTQSPRPATVHDGLEDVRGKKVEPQPAPDVNFVHVMARCNLDRVCVVSDAQLLHPRLGAGDREQQRAVDAP